MTRARLRLHVRCRDGTFARVFVDELGRVVPEVVCSAMFLFFVPAAGRA